ncbi:MAG: DNA adenine methylase [Acidobacteriota bacterium]
MNYIGSKFSLLPFIEKVFCRIQDGKEKVVCDLFAGTAAVGRFFKRKGLRVIANDLQYYAYVLNKAYLELNQPPPFKNLEKQYAKVLMGYRNPAVDSVQAILSFINQIAPQRGFITENYAPCGNRFYYTQDNAERADAIRQTLERWRKEKIINEREYFYLLCSLLEAIDQVANTASVYGAYLKKFKASARKPLKLKPLELTNGVRGCKAYNQDANQLIKQITCDVLYLDPPYNHRQYGANYHVLETIAAYDAPQLRGVTGMRDYPRSRYCKPLEALEAMRELITAAQTKHILVSYNDEGIMSLEDIRELLSLRGEPQTFSQKYNRFKADNGRQYKRGETVEYLHYVRVVKS